MNEQNSKVRCNNCAYPTTLTAYRDWSFCEICASTYLSRATTNSRQYGEQAPLFQSLGYIANLLRDEIRQDRNRATIPTEESHQ